MNYEVNNNNDHIIRKPETQTTIPGSIKRRPEVVLNHNSEDDMIPLITRSANVNYAKIRSRRNKTFIFSDSIAKRINMNEFNNRFPAGDAFKQSFSGVTASKLRCCMKPWLIEEEPENVIIQVGTNNITKKAQKRLHMKF